MAVSPEPSVSVIIPVYNGGNDFSRCLESLGRCSPVPDEVIVVADGESDGAWKEAADRGYRTILLENRSGPAYARNCGAQNASGEILFFIDADVEVQPGAIAQVSTFFADHPDYAAVFGSYDDKPSAPGLVSQYRNLLHHFTHQNGREETTTFWAGCGAIRRSIFETVKGFDPSYRVPSIEDIELGYRLRAQGHKVKLKKDLLVKHLKRWNLFSMLKTDIRSRGLPWSDLLLREKSIPSDLNLSMSARISALTVLLLLVCCALLLFSSQMIAPALACIIVLLLANRDFYTFLAQRRGILFLLGALPLHWLYFFYSGGCFLYVYIKVFLDNHLFNQHSSAL